MGRRTRSLLGSAADLSSFAAFHFNPAEIDGLIRVHGSDAEYRKGSVCPCSRIETGMGAVGCDVCRGLSWVYPQKRRGWCRFLDSSRTASAKWEPSGFVTSGTLSVTFPSGLVPAAGDMLLPCGEIHVVHEQFHRGVQQVNQGELRARARADGNNAVPRRLTARVERLLYDNVVLESIYWIEIINGKDELVEGRENVDFRLVSEGAHKGTRIDWVGARGPGQGKGYSVRYQAPAAYLVKQSVPVFRRENNTELPWKAVLGKLSDLAESDLR
jgi:hypothetical protein